MKVIFLDIDGVINDVYDMSCLINPEFVMNIKKVIDVTNAKVVITSRRRDNTFDTNTSFYNEFILVLKSMGIDIISYTPRIKLSQEHKEREVEIETYLNSHSEVSEYVIIEDDYVMERLYDHQVFIESSHGFTSEFIKPAIDILNGTLGFYPPSYDRSETYEERLNRLFPNLFTPPNIEVIGDEDYGAYEFPEGTTWDDVEKELLKSIKDIMK